MDMTPFADATPDYHEVLYDVRDWVARITLNREKAYNAYSTAALVELAHAFRRASFDDRVAVIVFTGAGTRAFCTGGGVKGDAAGAATQWLPVFVGDRRARYMLMTNRPIPAAQALEWGLVNEVVPSVRKDGVWIEGATSEQIESAPKGKEGYAIDLRLLDDAVRALCAELIEKFPESMRYTKQQVNFWKDLAWHQTIGHARDWLSIHYASWEPLEG